MCDVKAYKGTSNTRIDSCMVRAIEFLNRCGINTVACCCGHNKYPMTIVVKKPGMFGPSFVELFSGAHIPRKRKFYVRDPEGYYYIPEAMEVR